MSIWAVDTQLTGCLLSRFWEPSAVVIWTGLFQRAHDRLVKLFARFSHLFNVVKLINLLVSLKFKIFLSFLKPSNLVKGFILTVLDLHEKLESFLLDRIHGFIRITVFWLDLVSLLDHISIFLQISKTCNLVFASTTFLLISVLSI